MGQCEERQGQGKTQAAKRVGPTLAAHPLAATEGTKHHKEFVITMASISPQELARP